MKHLGFKKQYCIGSQKKKLKNWRGIVMMREVDKTLFLFNSSYFILFVLNSSHLSSSPFYSIHIYFLAFFSLHHCPLTISSITFFIIPFSSPPSFPLSPFFSLTDCIPWYFSISLCRRLKKISLHPHLPRPWMEQLGYLPQFLP